MTRNVGSSGHRGKQPGGSRLRVVFLVGGLLAVGLVAGLLLENLYRTRPRPTAARETERPRAPSFPPVRLPGGGPAARPLAEEPERPTIPPWESTPENTPSIPPGHIPAWEVKSPRPEPAPPPVPPVPPPDPASTRPPMHNPGGVNGDRPARPAPGLQ